MKNIPKADLKEFLSEDSHRKSKFVQFIGNAFQEIGFIALKGHFLEDILQEKLYSEIHSFFMLPNEKKSSYEL